MCNSSRHTLCGVFYAHLYVPADKCCPDLPIALHQLHQPLREPGHQLGRHSAESGGGDGWPSDRRQLLSVRWAAIRMDWQCSWNGLAMVVPSASQVAVAQTHAQARARVSLTSLYLAPVSGTTSDGLITTALPATNAGSASSCGVRVCVPAEMVSHRLLFFG